MNDTYHSSLFSKHDGTKWKIHSDTHHYSVLYDYITECWAPFPLSVKHDGFLFLYASSMDTCFSFSKTQEFYQMLMDICAQIQFYRERGFGFIGFNETDIVRVSINHCDNHRFIFLSETYLCKLDLHTHVMRFPYFSSAPIFFDDLSFPIKFPLVLPYGSCYRALCKYIKHVIVKHDVFMSIKLEGFLRRLNTDCLLMHL